MTGIVKPGPGRTMTGIVPGKSERAAHELMGPEYH